VAVSAAVYDRTVRTGDTPVRRRVRVGDTVLYNTATTPFGVKATVLDVQNADGVLHLRLTTTAAVVKNVPYGDQEDVSSWYFPLTQ
jgi:hypothetical protein